MATVGDRSQGTTEDDHHHLPHPDVHEVERWALEGVLSTLALAWTALVIVVALAIAWPETTARFPGVAPLVRDTTSWALLIALVGVGLGVIAKLGGARHVGPITAGACVLGTIVVLAPIVGMWRIASEHGASISLFENLEKVTNTGYPVPERSVTYATIDGQELALDVWVPGSTTAAPAPVTAGAAPRPAVVMVHGGGWVTGDRGTVPLWNQLLNDRGYAVFDIQYRLATPSTPRWDQAAGDVLCAVGWVKAHAGDYGIDPARVALMGESAGGELVLQAAYGTGGKPTAPTCPTPDPSVRAVVSFYPGTEFVSLWQSDSAMGFMRPWVEAYQGGTPDAVPAHYDASSPVRQAKAGVPPTLVLHGLEDDTVPVEQTTQLSDVLSGVGADHEEITLPLMEHAFDHSWHSLGTQVARDVVPRYLAQHLG